jgi:hypothetical protein
MCDAERKISEFWNFISKHMKVEAALADWRLMLGTSLILTYCGGNIWFRPEKWRT